MSETVLATIGIAAGIINLSASIPYFIDIFRGNTKPERATWWIWFALGSVGLFGQIAGGARWSLVPCYHQRTRGRRNRCIIR